MQDLSGVRLQRPAKQFHQRGFARAIVTDESKKLPGSKLEIHIVGSNNRAESLRQSLGLKNRAIWLAVHIVLLPSIATTCL
jgi:hypothetical protein